MWRVDFVFPRKGADYHISYIRRDYAIQSVENVNNWNVIAESFITVLITFYKKTISLRNEIGNSSLQLYKINNISFKHFNWCAIMGKKVEFSTFWEAKAN